MNKKPDVVALRTIRKISHIAGRITKKGSHFLDKIESKSTRIIINKTGSPDTKRSSVNIDEVVYHSFPHITPVHPGLPIVGQRPSVTVFAFLDPKGFYGGIATLLCVGATLANKLGYDFRVAQTTGFSNNTDVLVFLKNKGIIIEEERFSTVDLSKRSLAQHARLPLHPEDIVLVSAWWDAHIASQLPLSRKFVYLIQDYEPIFYNNSDQSIWADQTYYSEKFIPLLNTDILHTFFKKNGYDYIAKNGISFEPAPAPNVKRIKKESETKTLFLYGRPHVHRNLYYSALKAIDAAFQDERIQQYDWQLYSAGSSDIPNIKLTSGHVINNKGKMPMDEYYQFATTIDIAVSPMLAPHPNYPTLEFASLGVPVVTTKWETKQNLDFYSPNIFMADASVEGMKNAIIDAVLMSSKTKKENQKNTHIDGSWLDALNPAIDKVANCYYKP